jgi:hypothetical protein
MANKKYTELAKETAAKLMGSSLPTITTSATPINTMPN